MATIKNSTEFLHQVHDPYADKFIKGLPGFHNLLWQLVVNEKYDKQIIIFHPVPVQPNKTQDKLDESYKDGYWELGIVTFNEGGFQRTYVTFVPTIDYDEACGICDELNEKLFGITPEFGIKIITDSMAIDLPAYTESSK